MSEHTPTPWHWEIHDSSAASIHGPEGMADHVLTVAPCKHCRGKEWVWGSCTNPTEANAYFIVRAVNSHDALVKALEWIAEVAGNPGVVKVARDALSHVGTSGDTP